jgi:ZIP family zinc transporter
MTFAQTILLGAIAGFTIYIGLPIGRLKVLSEKARTFLSMISVGIILFLLIDIFTKIAKPIESALKGEGGAPNYPEAGLLVVIFLIGFGVGLLGLIVFEQRFLSNGSGAKNAVPPARLALMIAIGLGLHNFSEGLAIGQSAGRGEIALAMLLIIGFGLHNATEGFGIVGPMAGQRPSWGYLGLIGLIGGGPTFLGTVLGYGFTSTVTSVLFLALAVGALVYVLGELLYTNHRPGTKFIGGVGLMTGLVIAFLTDMVLVIAGA